MTYIDYLNSFNQWLESNTLPGNAQLLFFRLLNVFNRAGWPEYVQVDTRRLTILADCEKDAAYRARDKLCDAGFLNYRKGKKGSPTIYFLSDKTTESTTETATESATETATVSATHIKTKTKNNTPPTPSRGTHAVSLPKYQPEWFIRFWSLYPRKTNRVQAVKAWDKLKPDLQLCKVMDTAIRAQMQTPQWQDPQHIPHPSTWLNGERWNDEIIRERGKEDPYGKYF